MDLGRPDGVLGAPVEVDAVRSHIRGSGLLLLGRILSVAVNLVVQILIVRSLPRTDYGNFAYALSLVQSAELVIALGLDRALTRFVAIFDEERRDDELLGTLVLQVATIVAAGAAVVALVIGLQGWLGGHLVGDVQAAGLLAVLILLAPLGALDSVLLGLFAVYAQPRVIFIRRYVLTPLLRLSAVLLVLVGSHNVRLLAAGYLVAGVIGLLFYLQALRRLLRTTDLGGRLRRARMSIPYRELLGFTLPLLTTDLVYFSMQGTTSVLLGRNGGAGQLATFNAVLSPARTIQMVMASAGLLFTPAAARAFARRNHEGLADLYWSTAAWIAVLSFPLFALAAIFAEPFTVQLFGARYRDSSQVLEILAVGYYVNVSLGFNGLMLKVAAHLRYLMAINVAAAVINVALCAVLIPSHGAIGAAWATSGTLIAHNALKQAGLRRAAGISPFDRSRAGIYAAIAIAAAALWTLARLTDESNLAVDLVAIALTGLVLLVATRRRLDLGRHFPEVARIPFVGRHLVGATPPASPPGPRD